MASRQLNLTLAPQSFLMRTALTVVRCLRWPIRMCGVDYPRFMTLLTAHTILDERRGTRQSGDGGARSGSPWSAGLLMSCIVNLIMGVFAGAALFIPNPVLALGIHQGIVFVFAMMILIADYSSVLLDDTDTAVVAPLPVADRTVVAARVAHIAVYLGVVLGSLVLPGLLLGCLARPALTFVPIYLLCNVLTITLAVAVGFGFFLLAMRFFDVERFRNLLVYVQVGVSISFFAGFQILPKLVGRGLEKDLDALQNRILELAPYLPPMHQGGLLALVEGDGAPGTWLLAGLALGLPLLAFVILVLLSSRGFLRGVSRGAAASKAEREVRPRRSWLRNLLIGDQQGRAGFDFFRALSRRERDYRLRTYPMIAIALVIGIAFSFRGGEFRNPVMMCSAIYLLGLYVPAFLMHARSSENWNARWLLVVAPMDRPGRFVAGAMLALVATTFLPVFVVFFLLIWAVGGHAVLIDAAFASLAMLVIGSCAILWFGRRVPFTEKPPKKGSAGSITPMIIGMVILGMVVGVHFLVRKSIIAFVVASAVLIGLAVWARVALGRLKVDPDTWPPKG